MVCPPRAAVLGSRTRVDAYNRSITKPLTGEPDAGDPPVRFGGRGKVQSLVPTPIPSSTAWTQLRRTSKPPRHRCAHAVVRHELLADGGNAYGQIHGYLCA